MLPSEGIPTLT